MMKNENLIFRVTTYAFMLFVLLYTCKRVNDLNNKINSLNYIILKQQKDLERLLDTIPRNDLTIENVKYWLYYHNISHPTIVLAQILLESGHCNSDLATKTNNVIGMKHPKIRKTTSIGSYKGYAIYASLSHCILDIKMWQDFYKVRTLTEQEYLMLLSQVYAEDEKYVEKISKIMNDYGKNSRN